MAKRPVSELDTFERTQETAVVTAPNGLNLRQGPHKDYSVLEVAPCGAILRVHRLPGGIELPDWLMVDMDTEDGPLWGFVHGDFVAMESDEVLPEELEASLPDKGVEAHGDL